MLVVCKKVTKAGKQHLKVGKPYEVSDETGNLLIAKGQAELPNTAKKKPKSKPKKAKK